MQKYHWKRLFYFAINKQVKQHRSKKLMKYNARITMLNDIVERDFASMSDKEILSIAKVAYKRELNKLDDDRLVSRFADAFGITGCNTYEEMVG